MNLRCIIVEDLEDDLELLQRFIAKEQRLSLAAHFNNVPDAKRYMQGNDADLIFCDIMVGDSDGLSFIRGLENPPQVIFTTSFPNFAVTGFELNATDYLVKPYTYVRFSQAIEKVMARQGLSTTDGVTSKTEVPEAATDHFFIRSKYNMIRINYDDVIYVEGMKDYVKIVTENQVYDSGIHLKIVEDQLPKTQFIRIHRSFMVNISKIDSLNNTEVVARGKTLPLGENYKENFLKQVVNKKILSKPAG